MTKVDAIKKLMEINGGVVSWQYIYDNIEKGRVYFVEDGLAHNTHEFHLFVLYQLSNLRYRKITISDQMLYVISFDCSSYFT